MDFWFKGIFEHILVEVSLDERNKAGMQMGWTGMSACQPRISCLMVTKKRAQLANRSIDLYCRQTWSNKELVIITDDDSNDVQALNDYISELGRSDIALHRVVGKYSLGQLRNKSIQLAIGEIICQWDDDDLNHPLRLEAQANHMIEQGADASFMYDQLHYLADSGELFWTDWSAQGGIPGTLMCRRSTGVSYPESGEHAIRGEDEFLRVELRRRFKVDALRFKGYLYTYVFHGRNTWDRAHHEYIVRNLGFSNSFITEQAITLGTFLRQYFPDCPTLICCKDGSTVPLGMDV